MNNEATLERIDRLIKELRQAQWYNLFGLDEEENFTVIGKMKYTYYQELILEKNDEDFLEENYETCRYHVLVDGVASFDFNEFKELGQILIDYYGD